ncbi:MAG: hypothetical protein ACTHK7_12435, partial [Aureliella sp.]
MSSRFAAGPAAGPCPGAVHFATARSILTQLVLRAALVVLPLVSLGIAPSLPLRADDFPKLYNSESEAATLLSPEEALRKVVLPEGFHATLFAHEPEVQNPIAMA